MPKTTKATQTKSKAAPKKTATKAKAAPKTKAKTTVKKAAAKKPAKKTKAAVAKPTGDLTIMGIEPYKEKRGEEYMSDGQREHFGNILLTWKQQLMEEVDRTVHHMQDDSANFADPTDRAAQEEEFSLELRARDRERKLIKKIESTLERLEGDDYGYCDACGDEIGIRRLEARPTASLCIDCKELEEIREKQGQH